jgi:hypothetical protein
LFDTRRLCSFFDFFDLRLQVLVDFRLEEWDDLLLAEFLLENRNNRRFIELGVQLYRKDQFIFKALFLSNLDYSLDFHVQLSGQ